MRAPGDDAGPGPARAGTARARRNPHPATLAELNTLVRALAHEARNALQRSQACLSLLRLRVQDDPDLLALVDEVEAAQDRVAELHEQVREFASQPRVRLQPLALDSLVRSAWSNVASGGGHRLELTVECQDTSCRSDPALLAAALEALLANALEAAPDGSTVRVSIADAADGRCAVSLTVRDEGPGVRDSLRERLFDLFYTTKPDHAGLGLPRARKQVACLGGELSLHATSQPGACFQVVLPRDP